MIRLVTVFALILMPIISVATGTTGSETVVRSQDLCDEICPPDGGGGRSHAFANDAFSGSVTLRSGS